MSGFLIDDESPFHHDADGLRTSDRAGHRSGSDQDRDHDRDLGIGIRDRDPGIRYRRIAIAPNLNPNPLSLIRRPASRFGFLIPDPYARAVGFGRASPELLAVPFWRAPTAHHCSAGARRARVYSGRRDRGTAARPAVDVGPRSVAFAESLRSPIRMPSRAAGAEGKRVLPCSLALEPHATSARGAIRKPTATPRPTSSVRQAPLSRILLHLIAARPNRSVGSRT